MMIKLFVRVKGILKIIPAIHIIKPVISTPTILLKVMRYGCCFVSNKIVVAGNDIIPMNNRYKYHSKQNKKSVFCKNKRKMHAVIHIDSII